MTQNFSPSIIKQTEKKNLKRDTKNIFFTCKTKRVTACMQPAFESRSHIQHVGLRVIKDDKSCNFTGTSGFSSEVASAAIVFEQQGADREAM